MITPNDCCQDIIRRFDELDANFGNSPKSVNSTDCSSLFFITNFNQLFNTNYSNLNDIFTFLQMKSIHMNSSVNAEDQGNIGLQIRNQQLESENIEFKHEIQRLQANCKTYQAKIEKLEKGIFKLHRKNINLQFEKETLASKIETLKSSLETIQQSSSNVCKDQNPINWNYPFDKICALFESTNSNISKYQEQRKTLIKTIEKQNFVLDNYESIIHNLKENQQQASKDLRTKITNDQNLLTDDMDKLYSILGGLSKFVEQINPEDLKNKIRGIIGDSSKQVQERIMNIFDCMIHFIEDNANSKINIVKESNQDNDNPINEDRQRSLRILSVMDEELLFLQQLAKSTELQSIVFPDDTKITTSFKAQLIDHCTKIAQFIEETLPKVSINSEIDKLPSLNIFAHILSPNDISEMISKQYETIVKTDEGREIFQLFASEVVISSIIRRYAIDCKMRLEKTRKLMNSMQKTVDDSNTLKNKIKLYQEQELKMRNILNSMFDTNPNTNFLTIFEAVIKYFKNQHENLPIITDLKVALAQNNREHSKEVQLIKKQYSNELKTIKKQYKTIEKELETLNNEKKEYLSQIRELEQKIKVCNDQAIDREQYYSDKNNQIIKNYENEKKDLEAEIQSLSNQITEKEKLISDQFDNITMLKKENQHTKKRNDDLEQFLLQSQNMITIKMNQLKASYEKTLQNLTDKVQSCNSLQKEIANLSDKNQNLTHSLAQMKMENQTISIQLKSNEEKWKNEISSLSLKLSSQLQAVTNEYSTKLLAIQSEFEKFSQAIGYTEFNLKPNSDGFTQTLDKLASRITSDLQYNNIYSTFYKTVITKLQSVKEVKDANDAESSISSLINENQQLRDQIKAMNDKIQTESAYVQRMKQIDHENTAKLIELKRWEIWGKRQFKTINGYDFERDENAQFDQIRALIEEEIWLSQGSSNTNEDNTSNECTTLLENLDDQVNFKTKDNHQRPKTLLPGIPPAD